MGWLWIEKQGTSPNLVDLSKIIVSRFHQTEGNVQSAFKVVIVLDVLGLMVFGIDMLLIHRLKVELKKVEATQPDTSGVR